MDCEGRFQFQYIAEAIGGLTAAFTAGGIEGAAGDARRLVAAATGLDTVSLISDPGRQLTDEEAARIAGYAWRRLAREPVSRIEGVREFYGRPFQLTPAVLDPRPDTETLIEITLAICQRAGLAGGPVRILDIGTGSGAILLTLLAELPEARGLGIDLDPEAIACAQNNARALGLEARAAFSVQDLHVDLPRGFEVMVANPPYIPTDEIAGLEPEVRVYDPRLALDGGSDGLAPYRSILTQVAAMTPIAERPHWVILEIGAGQASDLSEIAQLCGFLSDRGDWVEARDLGGHVRCVAIRSRI
jgi:release factor glutamine methyltransferase